MAGRASFLFRHSSVYTYGSTFFSCHAMLGVGRVKFSLSFRDLYGSYRRVDHNRTCNARSTFTLPPHGGLVSILRLISYVGEGGSGFT